MCKHDREEFELSEQNFAKMGSMEGNNCVSPRTARMDSAFIPYGRNRGREKNCVGESGGVWERRRVKENKMEWKVDNKGQR